MPWERRAAAKPAATIRPAAAAQEHKRDAVKVYDQWPFDAKEASAGSRRRPGAGIAGEEGH